MQSVNQSLQFDGLAHRVTPMGWVQLLAPCHTSYVCSSFELVLHLVRDSLEALDKGPEVWLFADDSTLVIVRDMHQLLPTMCSGNVNIYSCFLVLYSRPHCFSATYKKSALLSWWLFYQPPVVL